MKNKHILTTLLTLSLIASFALVGCGKANNAKDAVKNKPVKVIDNEQYLNGILTSEPITLDPSKATDVSSSDVLVNSMEGLTRIEQGEDKKHIIKGAGAEKWEYNEEKTIWTFHLRDYQWSDGKPVTAYNFVYAVTRSLNPKVGSTYAFILYPLKNAKAYNTGKAKVEDVGVKALDSKTVQFTLEKPCPYFLDLTGFKVMFPQRRDIVEAQGDKFGTEANTMVFCGPYILKNWTHESKIELEKNPNYWDKDSVKLQKLTFNIIKDETARMNSLFSGLIDYAAVSKQEWIGKFNATGKFNVIKDNEPGTNYMFFNQKDKYFANAKIRQAFSLATDREERIKSLFRGLGQPAYGFCPPTIKIGGEDFRTKVGVEPLKKFKESNPDAKALLIAGLKEIGADPDPAKATFTYLQSGTTDREKEFAKYDKQMYKKNLGIDLKIDYVEWPEFQKRIKKMDYQIGGMAWIADYNDPNTFFDMWVTGVGIVPTGWSNAKYDSLIKQAAETAETKKRIELFKQAEQMLLIDQAVISPTQYKVKKIYKAKYIKRVMTPLFGAQDFKYAYTNGRK